MPSMACPACVCVRRLCPAAKGRGPNHNRFPHSRADVRCQRARGPSPLPGSRSPVPAGQQQALVAAADPLATPGPPRPRPRALGRPRRRGHRSADTRGRRVLTSFSSRHGTGHGRATAPRTRSPVCRLPCACRGRGGHVTPPRRFCSWLRAVPVPLLAAALRRGRSGKKAGPRAHAWGQQDNGDTHADSAPSEPRRVCAPFPFRFHFP